MDINEIKTETFNRHPWELSRTESLILLFSKYLNILHDNKDEKEYVNIGAGDMYFDRCLLSKYKKDKAHCVDIGYNEDVLCENNGAIKCYRDLPDKIFDYAIMMDSLEYMENDVEYLGGIANLLKAEGLLFITIPANRKLFSEHDLNVGNLRRYDKKDIIDVINKTKKFEVEYISHFYLSLYMIRLFEKCFGIRIDKNKKVTTGWKYKENNIVILIAKTQLNLDFWLCNMFRRFVPGLSLLVIARKK